MLRGEDDLTTLLDRVRITFQLRATALLHRADARTAWSPLASSGAPARADLDGGTALPVDDLTALVVTGREPTTSDTRVLSTIGRAATSARPCSRRSVTTRAAHRPGSRRASGHCAPRISRWMTPTGPSS